MRKKRDLPTTAKEFADRDADLASKAAAARDAGKPSSAFEYARELNYRDWVRFNEKRGLRLTGGVLND